MDGYSELMRDLYGLKKDDLVVFGRNIGMIDVNLTGTIRKVSKSVKEHIDTVLQGVADETAEIARLQEQISTFKIEVK